MKNLLLSVFIFLLFLAAVVSQAQSGLAPETRLPDSKLKNTIPREYCKWFEKQPATLTEEPHGLAVYTCHQRAYYFGYAQCSDGTEGRLFCNGLLAQSGKACYRNMTTDPEAQNCYKELIKPDPKSSMVCPWLGKEGRQTYN